MFLNTNITVPTYSRIIIIEVIENSVIQFKVSYRMKKIDIATHFQMSVKNAVFLNFHYINIYINLHTHINRVRYELSYYKLLMDH